MGKLKQSEYRKGNVAKKSPKPEKISTFLVKGEETKTRMDEEHNLVRENKATRQTEVEGTSKTHKDTGRIKPNFDTNLPYLSKNSDKLYPSRKH